MMGEKLFKSLSEKLGQGEAVVLASVIATEGSSSVKTGARLLLDQEGRTLYGWIGGGCIESIVRQEARQAVQRRAAKVVEVTMDESDLGFGLPCGGKMEIYLDPILPEKKMVLIDTGHWKAKLCRWAEILGYEVISLEQGDELTRISDLTGSYSQHNVLVCNADLDKSGCLTGLKEQFPLRVILDSPMQGNSIEIHGRQASCRIRRVAGKDAAEYQLVQLFADIMTKSKGLHSCELLTATDAQPVSDKTSVWLVGEGSIAEAISRFAHGLGWSVRQFHSGVHDGCYSDCLTELNKEVMPDECFAVLAGQNKDDHLALRILLARGVRYAGLVASKKRAGKTMQYLREQGIDTQRLYAPVGLDIGAVSAEEIALSITCQIIQQKNQLLSRQKSEDLHMAL